MSEDAGWLIRFWGGSNLKRSAIVILIVVSGLYLLLNLVVVCGVIPQLHIVNFHVTVVDDETGTPLEDVQVSLHKTFRGEKFESTRETTDESGKVRLFCPITEQPAWGLPRLGCFKFHGISVQCEKPGYNLKIVDIASEFPDVPYRRESDDPVRNIDVRVRMKNVWSNLR